MTLVRTTLLLVLAVLLPRSAHAAPSDLTFEVSPNGLVKLANQLKALMPRTLTWGDVSGKAGCLSYSMTAGQANTSLDDVRITTGANTIAVDVRASIGGTLDTSVNLCITGTNKCQVSFNATRIDAHASFTPRLVNGVVDLSQPQISVTIPDATTSVVVSSCALAGLANQLISDVKAWVLGALNAWIQDAINDRVKPLVRDALRSIGNFKGDALGFSVDATLSSLLVTTSAVRATGAMDLAAATVATGYCAVDEPPALPPTKTLPNLGQFSEHIALGISTRTVTQALRSLWRTGWLCFDDARMQLLGLDKKLSAAGLLLGIGQIKRLRARVPVAPTLRAIGGPTGELVVNAPFEIEITTAKDETIIATIPVELRGNVIVDPLTRALRIDVKFFEGGLPTLEADKGVKLPDPKVVKAAVDSLALPTAKSAITSRALVPQVLHKTGGALDDLYLLIKRRSNTTDFVRLYAELFSKPEHDSIPPTTTLTSAPPRLTGTRVQFLFAASGSDQGTPTELLRYSWRVDGGTWSEPTFGTGAELKLADGPHLVEVKAIDLNDNEDPTPVRYDLEVDGVAPKISFVDKPAATVAASSLTVEASVSDDRSPAGRIAVKLLLQRVDGGHTVDVVAHPFIFGATRFDLTGLASGDYRVELVAKDEAGNESPKAEASFHLDAPASPQPPQGAPSVTPSSRITGSGCAAAPGRPDGALLVLLALALLVALRRRRGPQ